MTKEEIGAIRATMSDNVGVIRDKDGLTEAIKYLEKTSAYSDMAFVGWLIARCALQREESRGAHFRSDFPETKAAGQRSRAKLARDNTLTITYI
jgi:L-aspartate oxidase